MYFQQWRSDKIIVGSVVHAAELNWKMNFFFVREAFCGLEYAENAFAAGASPRIPVGELTTLFQSAGRAHPLNPHPTKEKGRNL